MSRVPLISRSPTPNRPSARLSSSRNAACRTLSKSETKTSVATGMPSLEDQNAAMTAVLIGVEMLPSRLPRMESELACDVVRGIPLDVVGLGLDQPLEMQQDVGRLVV